MKIESGRSITPSGAPRRTQPAGASGFAVATDGPQKTVAATGAAATASVDAILALQAEEGPAQRRARQPSGRAALDALEALEQGLLLGRAPGGLTGALQRLHAEAEATGEEGLDSVLREIDTRLAVELAKLEMRGRA
jgi:hypothetical protein